MKKQHRKNTFIFKNNFSIRKLKFGVASITLGSALIIGAHQEADENSGNQNDNVSTNQNVQNKDQSTQQVQNQPKIHQLHKIQILKIINLLLFKTKTLKLTIQKAILHNQLSFQNH